MIEGNIRVISFSFLYICGVALRVINEIYEIPQYSSVTTERIIEPRKCCSKQDNRATNTEK